MSTQPDSGFTSSHDSLIQDQFSRQAELFARSPELHGDAQVMLLVDAARAKPADESLDVACGPGTVVAAFAARVRRAVGLDATGAMLDQARALAAERNLVNVEWQLGDVYRLRFVEIAWVCRSNGRVVLCDREASPRSNSKMVGWLVWLQKTSGSRSGGVEFRIFRI
jgi:SAM-dependent methyltransferase